MIDFIDGYKAIYKNDLLIEVANDIIDMKINKDLLTNSNIKDLVKKAYKVIRQNSDTVNIMYDIITDFIAYIDHVAIDDDLLYNRVLSLVALKNDAKLQQNLNERQIDLYLEEIKYIIGKKAYLKNNSFTPPKIAECLAKIQYAYQLIGSKKRIRYIFVEFMTLTGNTDVYKKILKELNSENHLDGESPGMMFIYYMFFRSEKHSLGNLYKVDGYHRYIMAIMFWKRHKAFYYNMTKTELEKEGYESYDFIYK